MRRDFWPSSGHHLLDRDTAGRLRMTDEFLKAYLARPELVPPPDACPAERRLHDLLLRSPRSAVTPSRIAAIADADARENWHMMLAWRDHLTRNDTLEAAYLDLVRHPRQFPRLFTDQLVHVILRNALDGCEDAFVLRAAEMLFRPQKLRASDGVLIARDAETTTQPGPHPVSPLYSLLGVPVAGETDILDEDNADGYFARSDRFDMALDLSAGRRGTAALGEVVRRWISHLLAVDAAVEPLTELRNAPLSWYVGLDAAATRIGDMLWSGAEIDEATRARLVGLYRLTFADPTDVIERVRGEPVYLLMAMGEDEVLRLKPQNIITGLPIRHAEAVH